MKESGFIFLITLIVIAVISILVLSSMQQILVYYKAENKAEELHRNFYQLEDVAIQLVKSFQSNLTCMAHQDSANLAIEYLLQHQGCIFTTGTNEYHYFIEDLGNFPCFIAYKHGRKYSTYHRRISVIHIKSGEPQSLLQLRFIAAGAVLKCQAQEHVIHFGISSWRYLAAIAKKPKEF
ncbi:MAG: type II secretion system protein [Legionella sp.]|uniref:type II secretion system protein n=1 Tax=Legionella sp. TaxID=459 RepID=UPI0039E25D6A